MRTTLALKQSASRQQREAVKLSLRLRDVRPGRAFTLIELLVVISIIGILAALIVAGAGNAGVAKVKKRVRVEMEQLITVIEDYHETKGFYPPDNQKNPRIPGQSPLFYELTGTVHNNNAFETIQFNESITAANVQLFFGIDGFVNSGPTRDEVKNFHKNLKPSQFKEISAAPDVELLAVPREGPNDIAGPNGPVNPWRYNSSAPVHNPNTYDLWAEIVIGGKTNIIGNWKE